MTQLADLIIIHGKLITMDTQRRILPDGALAVQADRIVAVGPSAEVASSFQARETIDAKGGIIQPGFIDCHVHLTQHLGRGIIPDTWPEEREHTHWLPYWLNLSEEEAEASTLLACLEMVRNGTTTFCDNGGKFSGELKARIIDRVGLRGMVSEVCWDIPPYPTVGVGDTDACLERLERLTQVFPKTNQSRIWAGVSMAGMGRCSDRLLLGGKKIADSKGLILDLHQSFGPYDVAEYRKQTNGKLAIEHFSDLGVLGENVQLVHMIYTEEREITLLAKSKTNVIHCPAASTRVAMGVSRVGRFPEMVAQGVNVALGSDSGNYSDFFDVGRQAYLAATIHREARGVMPTISAEQALEMATVNGAKSLGVLDITGSLEVGKKADVVIHSNRRPECHPGLNIVNTLIYSSQSAGVDTVVVDGETILKNGRFLNFDEDEEYGRIDHLAQNLHRRMGFEIRSPWLNANHY